MTERDTPMIRAWINEWEISYLKIAPILPGTLLLRLNQPVFHQYLETQMIYSHQY